jgi:hypothetical protein
MFQNYANKKLIYETVKKETYKQPNLWFNFYTAGKYRHRLSKNTFSVK